MPDTVTFSQAFRFWLKLGFISFGGPAGQIAIMHEEIVEKRRWISERRFLHALDYCMVLPGPEAQQLATYIGWLMHRTWGGIVAGALFVLPSLVILIGLSWIYVVHGDTPLVAGIFHGIKPAVAALVVHATVRIGKRALGHPLPWLIAAASLIALTGFGVPFPWIIVAAALVGVAGGRWVPDAFRSRVAHAGSDGSLVDDPRPAHTRFAWKRLAVTVVVGLALWIVPIVLAFAMLGPDHVLTRMAWFFTKAALLTFGGAYAVLPYVVQGAVTQFGWLTAGQMIDGLALGETTPGPLIIVVAFVAFVGGHGAAFLGADHAVAAGVIAAAWVTWFTFLPSFLFILIGGPLVEATEGQARVGAPMTAITAAVVGVIASLALFFGQHVLWPQGFGGPFDLASAVIAVAAAIALIRFRVGVTTVIAVCAVLGLLTRLSAG